MKMNAIYKWKKIMKLEVIKLFITIIIIHFFRWYFCKKLTLIKSKEKKSHKKS